MTLTQKDQAASEMIRRCALKEDIAIDNYDMSMFFKYHGIALRLIEYRIGLTRRMFNIGK